MSKFSQEIHIHNPSSVAIAGRDQRDFDLSQDKTVLVTEAREFRKRLDSLIGNVETGVEAFSVREAALSELRMIRGSLQEIENGSDAEQRTALKQIKAFSERLQRHTGPAYEVIKDIKEGSEVLDWLIKGVTTLAGFLI